MKLLIYTRSCLACKHKAQWKRIKSFAKEKNLEIQERRVYHNNEWKDEAKQWEIELPFIVLGRNAIDINEDLERLL